MEAIWAELSKPLPPNIDTQHSSPSGVTPERRKQLSRELDSCEFGHLAEGRANVVFTIATKDPAEPFKGTLLRVPKATPGVTPCDYDTLQRFHEEWVETRVGREHIVPQLLISISPRVAEVLNAKRDKHDGSVIQAGHAMLIQDMSPSPDYLGLEFKPKWLAQSPLAPADATRCRTCAREAYRNSKDLAKGKKKTVSAPICPLGFMHRDPAVVRSTIDRLAPTWSGRDRERLGAALRSSGLLERLRALQVEGDPDRALFDAPGHPPFGLAMTLRDCSCFVRVPRDGRSEVVIKLADVDKKNWREKQTYWQDSHHNLVRNGWYTGQEVPPMETACVLRLDYCLANGIADIPAPFRQRLASRSS
ncbi:inositol-pentakisphosphate 2-kinase-domain-containing protein [Xylariomycetidae sp. FL2044]|nr:inositol-pentakisphosphate 2-kinase-domain-containing protein [Xylariomycetidae sp. FL2044]